MINKNNPLEEYKSKRDFNKTPEPQNNRLKKHKNPIFVVQKHEARRLHYDLRLELNGVLKSWALPKGFSNDPKERHLAIQTEDHPMGYAKFHGTIPEGEYGAGTVEIWDHGLYKNLKNKSLEHCIKDGELAIWFEGEKLKGGYALIRTHYGDSDKNWILVKMHDNYAKE